VARDSQGRAIFNHVKIALGKISRTLPRNFNALLITSPHHVLVIGIGVLRENMRKVIFSWSGGKDSAMALGEILSGGAHEVAALLTTVTADYNRVSMHGVRVELLEKQALSLGLKLEKVLISKESDNKEYEAKMRRALVWHIADGVDGVVFGDIFLEDLKKYREDKLSVLNLKGIFPIWKRDTKALARHFINSGFKAVITCVDSKFLPKEFAGRKFDEKFLAELPEGVDPCGENGEFHSFVYDGPIFKNSIDFTTGDVVLRDERFYFCDLLNREAL